MPYAKTILTLVLPLMTFVLTGCFSSNPADIQAFLKPYEVDVTAKSYILGPPDEIEVLSSNVPEIHQQRQRIRPDGKISFQNFGEIEAAGKTPEQLAQDLKQMVALRYTLAEEKPIDVRISVFKSKVFYVLGQVYFPGPRDYTGYDTVLRALADAQPNPMAWVERIQVVRPSSDKNVKPKVFEANLKRMMKHGDTSKDVLLQEGDIVYVPPTILGAIALKIEEFVRPIARSFATVNVVSGAPGRR